MALLRSAVESQKPLIVLRNGCAEHARAAEVYYTLLQRLKQQSSRTKSLLIFKALPHNSSAALAMPFLPSASCRNLDLPPVNLRFLQSHLTKNAFAIAPTHLCGIALIPAPAHRDGRDEWEDSSRFLSFMCCFGDKCAEAPGWGSRPPRRRSAAVPGAG